jgi:hypothetical protein
VAGRRQARALSSDATHTHRPSSGLLVPPLPCRSCTGLPQTWLLRIKARDRPVPVRGPVGCPPQQEGQARDEMPDGGLGCLDARPTDGCPDAQCGRPAAQHAGRGACCGKAVGKMLRRAGEITRPPRWCCTTSTPLCLSRGQQSAEWGTGRWGCGVEGGAGVQDVAWGSGSTRRASACAIGLAPRNSPQPANHFLAAQARPRAAAGPPPQPLRAHVRQPVRREGGRPALRSSRMPTTSLA